MVFNWVNDNGTSFDNITLPRTTFFSSENSLRWEDLATQRVQAKAVIESNDGLIGS